jgi:DNA polymerase-3 subunit epsilon
MSEPDDMRRACAKYGGTVPGCSWLDTARVARRTWESVGRKGYGLANLAKMLDIEFHHHDALEDAKTAGLILCAAIEESGRSTEDWLARVKQPIAG